LPLMRILVAEDEPRIAAAVARGLRREGMAVDVAPDGAAALYKARVNPYDVVVLDRDLPEVHGDEVCRTLSAEQPRTKVLMLTAARSTDELVQGLSLGADDYLTKPFRFAELVARLRALGRRTGDARPPVLEAGDVVLDPAKRTASRAGLDLDLTLKEFAVLQALLEAQGAVVTPEELLERAWDEQLDPLSNTVRMTVMTLRRKLGDPPLIQTVRGSGYRV
jgi:two-component system response regulator VanR